MTSRIPIVLVALLCFVATPVAFADNATAAHAQSLAATCSTCHTHNGANVASIPPLDGRPAADTVRKMRAFRSGERAGTVMPQLARGYTEADIDAIARWYAARPP